ncbi:MAG TPA: hypothetical protein PKW79_01740 [Rhabdochlamydiaceae bacterium]|nr:hypothetical protein [Rhabdochlamydiaceae bacterium]
MVLKSGFWKKMTLLMGGALCLMAPIGTSAANSSAQTVPAMGWKEFHAGPGNCSMMFPNDPEHISEKMAMPDEGFELKYDAYISSSEQQTVFMLLIAQYPSFVDESYAQMSLEGFLNGILTHNPGNQLLFADLLLVDGHEALDFFIRTGNIYFKGRAVMVKNSLYLMAMECEIPQYDEVRYKHFVSSFKLHQVTAKK